MTKTQITPDEAKARLLAGETIIRCDDAEVFFSGGVLYHRKRPTARSESLGSIDYVYLTVFHWFTAGPLATAPNPDEPMLLADLFPLLKEGDQIECMGGGKARILNEVLCWMDSDNSPALIHGDTLASKWKIIPKPLNLLEHIKEGVSTFKTRNGRKAENVDHKPSVRGGEHFVGVVGGTLYTWNAEGQHSGKRVDSIDLVALWDAAPEDAEADKPSPWEKISGANAWSYLTGSNPTDFRVRLKVGNIFEWYTTRHGEIYSTTENPELSEPKDLIAVEKCEDTTRVSMMAVTGWEFLPLEDAENVGE